MAHDYEDLHDLEDLSDDELRQLVRERLADHPGLDADDITVEVEQRLVRLTGRIGTGQELRVAEHVVTDVLGPTLVENELVVDPLRPPDMPTPEGLSDTDDIPGARGEDR